MGFSFTPPPQPLQISPHLPLMVGGGVVGVVVIGLVAWSVVQWVSAPVTSIEIQQQQNGEIVQPASQNSDTTNIQETVVSREIPIYNPSATPFPVGVDRIMTAEEKVMYGFPAEWTVKIKSGSNGDPIFDRVQ